MSDSFDTQERERRTEAQRLRDRKLIEAVENKRSIGEEWALTGEAPSVDLPPPSMPGGGAPTPVGGMRAVDHTPVAAVRAVPVRRRIWPRVLQVLAGLFAIVVIYFLFTLWQVWSTGRSDEQQPVDAIVVMGAAQYDGRPSPQLEARLDHVIELWPKGLASLIVVTGGNQPGDRFTEAEASAGYLEDHGVDAGSILLESTGTSTYESLTAVVALLEFRGLHEVLIVTDPYHALRSKLIAEELGLEAHVSPTPTSVVTGTKAFERQLGEAAGVAVGRIIGFDRLDDLTD